MSLWFFLFQNLEYTSIYVYTTVALYFSVFSFPVSSDLEDLKMMVGMSEKSADNLHEAFEAVLDGDERPLRKLGMPEEEWYDVSYMLDKIREGGLEVWRHCRRHMEYGASRLWIETKKNELKMKHDIDTYFVKKKTYNKIVLSKCIFLLTIIFDRSVLFEIV